MTNEITSEDQSARKDFTKSKMNWVDCLLLDPRLTFAQKCYGVYVAMRINWKTSCTFVADATVADEIGMSRGHIHIARKVLVETAWLRVYRRNAGSPYTFMLDHRNVNAMLDRRTLYRDQRADARKRRGAKSKPTIGLTTKPLPKIEHPIHKPLLKIG